jgi:hypothetical protein
MPKARTFPNYRKTGSFSAGKATSKGRPVGQPIDRTLLGDRGRGGIDVDRAEINVGHQVEADHSVVRHRVAEWGHGARATNRREHNRL